LFNNPSSAIVQLTVHMGFEPGPGGGRVLINFGKGTRFLKTLWHLKGKVNFRKLGS